jgi:hypothetical protein
MFHWLARMFTVPRAVRKQLSANPLVGVAKTVVASEVQTALQAAVTKNVSDPTQAALVMTALTAAINSTGVFGS